MTGSAKLGEAQKSSEPNHSPFKELTENLLPQDHIEQGVSQDQL